MNARKVRYIRSLVYGEDYSLKDRQYQFKTAKRSKRPFTGIRTAGLRRNFYLCLKRLCRNVHKSSEIPPLFVRLAIRKNVKVVGKEA